MVNYLKNAHCSCGKIHSADIYEVVTGPNAIDRLGEFVSYFGAKNPFLLADTNTFAAAGDKVRGVLERNGIPYSAYIFPQEHLEPDEAAVGSAVMHFDTTCDLIIAIGSGVVNDIGKILSNITGKKYIVIATAPSMDGYASATSSMSMDGLKVSLPSRCADVIIGDTEILKNTPAHMLKAGLGDILAKYVSIAEWRIAHIITGEYYCEQVAQLIRETLKRCVEHAEGLLKREEKAVEAVFEGLVVSGIAMAYAGVSRPASGVEHYFSHIWDMRGLEFGTNTDLHGIQCAMATLQAVKLYERVKKMTPDAPAARAYVDRFSYEDWKTALRKFLGNSAKTMILQEEREQKYNKATHPARLEKIITNWENILQVLHEELPTYEQLADILNTVGISADLETIGVDSETAKMTFRATKDIRDKYVLSRLAWDLGVLDELCDLL
ncbi:MAG: sn-glycerol-1-phosphate dehydrogenase [Oscillospiraceae bacterium]|nr:sn-glycerol-1-phosphate dehydrogenase [Oscillospiraceae bacterium]